MNKQQRLVADGYAGVEPVLFYSPRDPYGWGSNYSRHTVELPSLWDPRERILYKTGEHAFQARKDLNRERHDRIAAAATPDQAKQLGGARGIAVLREGWGSDYGHLCWYVMLEVVVNKARQHATIRRELLGTGERPVYEDSPVDDIWGWRFENDFRGKNLLGRCWMEARELLGGQPPRQPQAALFG